MTISRGTAGSSSTRLRARRVRVHLRPARRRSSSTRSTPTRAFTWPPPGFTTEWWGKAVDNEGVREALRDVASRSASSRRAIALVLGTLLAVRARPLPLLRPRVDLAARDPADRAARHRHRHRAQQRRSRRSCGGLVDLHGDHRPRDVLHRRRLQQRRSPGSAAWAAASRRPRPTSAPSGWQTFRLVTFPLMRSALVAGAHARVRACPSTRSSSRRSPPARASRRCRSGSSRTCSARTRRRSSTWSPPRWCVVSIVPIYLAQRFSNADERGGGLI